MAVPIYQQISPDKAKIMNMNRALGESAVQHLSEYARQASIELYSIRDEQEKINQIYRFLYYYLLSYEYSDIPVQETSELETLRKEHQELIEKFEEVKLMETNEQLIQQLKIQKTLKRAKALENKSSEEKVPSLEQQLHQEREKNQKLEQELNMLRTENKEIKEKFEELNSKYVDLLMQNNI